MEKWKKWVNEIFIDGLGGMASGLFATLIIGTIIQQVGNLVPGTAGDCLFMMGKVAAAVTGAGIGCGVAVKLKASPLVMLSAATSGMMGAFAGKIMEGAVLVEGTICLSGPGEPLGAFIAATVGIYAGYRGQRQGWFLGLRFLHLWHGLAQLSIGEPFRHRFLWGLLYPS